MRSGTLDSVSVTRSTPTIRIAATKPTTAVFLVESKCEFIKSPPEFCVNLEFASLNLQEITSSEATYGIHDGRRNLCRQFAAFDCCVKRQRQRPQILHGQHCSFRGGCGKISER